MRLAGAIGPGISKETVHECIAIVCFWKAPVHKGMSAKQRRISFLWLGDINGYFLTVPLTSNFRNLVFGI